MKTNKYVISNKFNKLFLAMTLIVVPFVSAPAKALESGIASLTAPKGDFYLELDPSDHADEQKEIKTLLDNIEIQWNAHNLEALMSNYADDYINNDGLGKKAVTDLTKDFWDQYPDAKSSSKTKEIRIESNYATVDSRDVASGSTAKEIQGINSKGELRSVSEGQLFLRKFGDGWKIIGDRINYEKVKVSYGLARQIDASFVAPEQVKAGRKYAAKLEVKLPNGLIAVGEITTQNLQYPSPQSVFPNSAATEVWKPLDTNGLEKDNYILERIMEANTTNHNELIMTTLGITNAARNSLVGLEFLTRRMNVVPAASDDQTTDIAEGAQVKKDVKATKLDDADSKKTATPGDETKTKSTQSPAQQPQNSTGGKKTPAKTKSHHKSST
jgi:ketosteroid isomerase-like protein